MHISTPHAFTACVALLLASCVTDDHVASQRRPISPPPEVLTQAADAQFPYISLVRSAERGDTAALLKLIQFSTRTDAYGSIAHGVVLLELREIYGFSVFARIEAQATKEEQATAQRAIDAAISVLNGPKV